VRIQDFVVQNDDEEAFKGNLKAPIEFCVRWKGMTRIPVKKQQYFGKLQRMGQGNLIYIGDQEARNMLSDAIEKHSDSPDIQKQLRSVEAAVWGRETMQVIWKIAPGKKAKFWEMCRDNQCIVVHWIGNWESYLRSQYP
jgi:hypothetical protein